MVMVNIMGRVNMRVRVRLVLGLLLWMWSGLRLGLTT